MKEGDLEHIPHCWVMCTQPGAPELSCAAGCGGWLLANPQTWLSCFVISRPARSPTAYSLLIWKLSHSSKASCWSPLSSPKGFLDMYVLGCADGRVGPWSRNQCCRHFPEQDCTLDLCRALTTSSVSSSSFSPPSNS